MKQSICLHRPTGYRGIKIHDIIILAVEIFDHFGWISKPPISGQILAGYWRLLENRRPITEVRLYIKRCIRLGPKLTKIITNESKTKQ